MTFNELRDKIFQDYEAGHISDEQLVQIIEQASQYLDLKTLSNYAKKHNLTYNGAKKRKKLRPIVIDSIKFIIDNE